jgi:hypothetical protein
VYQKPQFEDQKKTVLFPVLNCCWLFGPPPPHFGAFPRRMVQFRDDCNKEHLNVNLATMQSTRIHDRNIGESQLSLEDPTYLINLWLNEIEILVEMNH